MSTKVKGIYKNGRVVLLGEPVGIEEAEVVVTFPHQGAVGDRATGDARRKQLLQRLRDRSFDFGGAPYPQRDELHDRGR